MATELIWDLQTADAWQVARASLESHGGLMVPAQDDLEMFQEVELVVRLHNVAKAKATGQVVQAQEGQVALIFDEEAKARLLDAQLEKGAAERDVLSKPEKIKLARHGNVDARRKILREPDQNLHVFLLSNPGLTAQEVAGWFRSKLVPRNLIDQIAKRPELVGNPQVMEALVADPRTPMPLALKLVPRLPMEVCRRIAKAGRLRARIVGAARKRVVS